MIYHWQIAHYFPNEVLQAVIRRWMTIIESTQRPCTQVAAESSLPPMVDDTLDIYHLQSCGARRHFRGQQHFYSIEFDYFVDRRGQHYRENFAYNINISRRLKSTRLRSILYLSMARLASRYVAAASQPFVVDVDYETG